MPAAEKISQRDIYFDAIIIAQHHAHNEQVFMYESDVLRKVIGEDDNAYFKNGGAVSGKQKARIAHS